MLRILGIMCNIFLVITMFIAVLSLAFIFTQTAGIPFPPALVNGIGYLLLPFILGIRSIMGGVYYSDFYGHKFEVSFGILILVAMGLFILLLNVSSALFKMDSSLTLFFRNLGHRLYTWSLHQIKNRHKRTSLGNLFVPEAEAVVAYRLENLEMYPDLKRPVERHIKTLAPGQWIYSQDNRALLRFQSTTEACLFIQAFGSMFDEMTHRMPLLFDYPPVFRFSVHSLAKQTDLHEEEQFIWAMLNCVAANQAYLSASAKEQLDMQQKSLPEEPPFKTTQLGTFSRLGNRTFPDIYRLSYEKVNTKMMG